MKIPLAQPFFDEREVAAVEPVIRSGWVSLGPKTAEFERRIADWIGVDHAVAVNSCTSAMQISLHLSGIGPGDEVVCPSFTCMATANAILQVGARPRFVEIDPATFNMDPAAVAAAITGSTKAIMVVHQIGLPADLDALTAIAGRSAVRIIEDAGCALGAVYRDHRVGSSGAPVCFSFHPRKTITTGEGGVLTTTDAEFAEHARAYRSHGASVSTLERHQSGGLLYGSYPDIGHNFRFTDIQAAIGLVQMDKIDDILERKARVARRYTEALSQLEHVSAPVVPPQLVHAWQSYLVTLSKECPVDRDAVIADMARHQIACFRGIAPLHLEPYFVRRLGPSRFPVTEDVYNRTVFLPIYAAMSAGDIEHVMTTFAGAIRGRR